MPSSHQSKHLPTYTFDGICGYVERWFYMVLKPKLLLSALREASRKMRNEKHFPSIQRGGGGLLAKLPPRTQSNITTNVKTLQVKNGNEIVISLAKIYNV